MLKPFTTERLEIQQLEIQDAPELAGISDTPAVSQWMAFMEGGALEKAQALVASQDATKEYFFAVRLPDGTLIGAMGVINHPDGSIEVGYWFGVDYQRKGYASEALRATLDEIAANPALAPRPVFAETRPDNVASIWLLTNKTGFYATARPGPRPNRIEFVLRQSGSRKGSSVMSGFSMNWNGDGSEEAGSCHLRTKSAAHRNASTRP
jgi:[ribosomal protein S5]-alanine N-acetyltransferase